MKGFLILVLVFGLACAKPFDDWFQELEESEGFERDFAPENSAGEPKTGEPHTGEPRPTSEPHTGEPHTGEPHTGEPHTGRPGPRPTGEPKPDLFRRFLHFLLVKSVEGVKPDKHPDIKYQKPGMELVEQLMDVREAVIKTFKPLKEMLELMKEDHIVMMHRVHKAVMNKNIGKAQYIVGEYFIALQRRIAMLFIQAAHRGLFDNVDVKGVDIEKVKRELKEHSEKAHEAAKFILANFNQYRVSDGLLDAPFVKLGVETSIVMKKAGEQCIKVFKTSMHVYTDLISKLVHLSLDMHKHDAAVHQAGASVLSFMRRGTKVNIALHRLYDAKKCYKGDKGDKDNEKED